MHEHINAAVLLNMRTEFEGDVAGDAACIPGDVNPEWIRFPHPLDSLEKVLNAGLSLGWEVLERVVALAAALD